MIEGSRWFQWQVADQALSLARIVRSFGTEAVEVQRYERRLGTLWAISYRKSVAYLAYLVVNASLFNCTKVITPPLSWLSKCSIFLSNFTIFYKHTDL